MENGTKLRLLYLYQHLLEQTDPDHTISTVELIQMLSDKHGMAVSRNTICNDLILLRESGLHIECIESTQNKYYYNGRPFEISELKILIDALIAAKFITKGITQGLISKLLTLTTEENALQLQRNTTVEGQVKSNNRFGYYSVDVINNAINLRRKIRFCYTDYDIHKQQYVANDGAPYTLSPYDLIWDGDFYYVRGFCDEREDIRTFRLDRMEDQPSLLSEVAVLPPADYNPVEYSKTVFRMFDTEAPTTVELLCDASTMKYLIDKFGLDFEAEAISEDTFRATVSVCTSSTFYRWIFGFAGKLKILSPQTVVDQYHEMARIALQD